MHFAQGKATEVDNALLSRSNGAMTLLTAVEGNSKALKSIKTAAATQLRESIAEVLNAEYGVQSDVTTMQNKNPSEFAGVRYRIGHTDKNNPVVMLEEDIFKGKEGKPHNIIAEYIAENIGKHYKIIESGQSVYIGKDLPKEFTQSKYTTEFLSKRGKLKNAKDQSAQNLGEIIEISTNRRWEKSTKEKHRTDAKYGFYKYTSRVALPKYDSNKNIVGSHLYEIELVIRNDADGKKYLYDIQNIVKIKEGNEQVSSTWSSKSDSKSSLPSTNRVPQDKNSVKSNSMHDGDIYSQGKRVSIPENAKMSDGIVITEESEIFRKKNPEGYKITKILAKDLGMKVMFVKGLTNSKGEVLDGVITSEGIFINTEAKDIVKFAVTHEFSHRMKDIAPKAWAKYQNYVIEREKVSGRYYAAYELKKGSYDEESYTAEELTAVIDEEIAADYIGDMFKDQNELTEFIKANRSESITIRDIYYGILDRLGLLDEKKKAEFLWRKAYREAVQNKDKKVSGEAKNSKESVSGTRLSNENKYITTNMSDAERAELISKKNIIAPLYEGQADAIIKENIANLRSNKLQLVKTSLITISEQFGIVGSEINIEDVGVKIIFSKSNIKESVSKETTPEEIAKLIPVLKDAVRYAVGIERHDNRYYYDTSTVFFENLLGGFVDGKYFVPVRFGLKHSITGSATLYVVVDQNKIPIESLDKIKKTEVINTPALLRKETATSAPRSVNINVSQIIPFVNSKDLLRYLPDKMLDEEQKKIKWEAVSETIKKTANKNDKKYKQDSLGTGQFLCNNSEINEQFNRTARFRMY